MSCAFPFLILRGGEDLSCVAALSWLFKDEPTKMFTMTITVTGLTRSCWYYPGS